VEVRSDNPHLKGTVTQTSRQGGRITYELKAVLDQDAPSGYVNDTLWLVTNDARKKNIPVTVEGRVTDAIVVSPKSLFLGTVQPGQTVEKRIVVRGQNPFRITAVRCDCPCLEATVPQNQENKSMFLVPVKFIAWQEDRQDQADQVGVLPLTSARAIHERHLSSMPLGNAILFAVSFVMVWVHREFHPDRPGASARAPTMICLISLPVSSIL